MTRRTSTIRYSLFLMKKFSVAFKSVQEIIFHVYTIFSLYTFRMYETKLKELETDIAKKTRSLTDLKQLVRQATEREQRVKKYTADLEQQASSVLVSSSPCVRVCVCLVAHLCLTLYGPMDCSTAGSSVHGISQTRILERVAIS